MDSQHVHPLHPTEQQPQQLAENIVTVGIDLVFDDKELEKEYTLQQNKSQVAYDVRAFVFKRANC